MNTREPVDAPSGPLTSPGPHVWVVGAALVHNGRCLVTRRGLQDRLAGKWEFPGGKVEPGETPEIALAREIKEELDLLVAVGPWLARGHAPIGDARQVKLDVYVCRWVGGELALREHDAFLWCGPEQLAALDWAEADIPIWPEVIKHL